MAKYIISVVDEEAEVACGTDQFYSGSKADIEVGFHAIHEMCGIGAALEDLGFRLVDSHNTFNSQNIYQILLAV